MERGVAMKNLLELPFTGIREHAAHARLRRFPDNPPVRRAKCSSGLAIRSSRIARERRLEGVYFATPHDGRQ